MRIENFEPASKHNNEYEEGKFLVLENKEVIEKYKWWVKEALERVKSIENVKGPVGAIICTETSGVPFGYALKAGLKELNKLNGDGPMPKFLRINVKPFRDQINLIKKGTPLPREYKEAEEKFQSTLLKWKEKINDLDLKDKNIFILDEFTYTGNTSFSVKYILESIGVNEEQIFFFFENIAVGYMNYPVWQYGGESESKKGTNPTETKVTRELKIGVRIVKGKEKREKAQNLIHDMKILGKLAAKELCQT
ncbi:MAG: hypothetical protein AAB723_02985 [Patescibacteria group bacterium]